MKWQFKDAYRGMWDQAHINQATEERKRNGARWNDAECRHLLAGYECEGLSVVKLARRHHRGGLGITIQLSRLLDNPARCAFLRRQLEAFELYAQFVPKDEHVDDFCRGHFGAQLSALKDGAAKFSPSSYPSWGQCGALGKGSPASWEQHQTNGVAGLVQGSGKAGLDKQSKTKEERYAADVIRAYAEGKDVQFYDGAGSNSKWKDYVEGEARPHIGSAAYHWRVKPERVERLMRVTDVPSGMFGQVLQPESKTKPNLQLVFEGEELIEAKVLK